MVAASDSKSDNREIVRVRVPPPPPSSKIARIVSMVRVFIIDNYSACYN